MTIIGIKVIHKKNEGLVSARQVGIENASGEYSLFVDSDDFAEKNLLETVNNVLNDNPDTDMVMYSFCYYENGTKNPRNISVFEDIEFFEGETKKKLYELLITTPYLNSLWTKAIKTEFLKNNPIDYSVLKDKDIAEDAFTVSHFITYCSKIINIDEVQDFISENNPIIIDLRGNTGGYLNVATDIASLFLKRNKTIYSLESKNDVEVVKDTTDTFRTLPIVVLINGGTASASEILAAALKESYGAIIVGSQSYGKGKVQQTSKLSDDTLVKYTTASWYTPTGDNVEGIGLEPGITVELSDDYFKHLTSDYDNQLQKAIEILASNE